MQRAGYKASAAPGYESDPVDDYSKRNVVQPDALQIGDDWAMIPANTAIDMGGCGKGYLADELAKMLNKINVSGFRLSLGGDIATFGSDANGDNWVISIQDSRQLDRALDLEIICPFENFAVATSGTFQRKSQVNNKGWHHIIDPTTLKPSITDVKLASVCFGSALQADVMASCVIILGTSRAIDFLKSKHSLAAFIQADDGQNTFNIEFGDIIKSKINSETSH